MNKILSILSTKKFWYELVVMTVGMFIAAAAVNYFLVPSHLVVGSISGLSIVISGVCAKLGIDIKVSVVILVINAILLVLAYFLIGKEFGAKTVYTALILGPMMDLWEVICPAQSLIAEGTNSVMGNIWFDLVCFVVLLSASQAVLFHINASTGGLDILAKIVNKYFHFDIGTSVTIAGAVICCSAFAINPFQMVVIGLIGTWINGIVVDYFTAGINRKKRVCIVTKDSERIRKYIIEELHRGCSLYEQTGGYTLEKNIEIQSILTMNEFSSLMNFLKTEGINCFVTAGNVSEVYGLWLDNRKKGSKQ